MKPIAVFYHCLTHLGNPPVIMDNAIRIINEQMGILESSRLLEYCSEFIVGINGGEESREIANLIIPSGAKLVMHGLQSRSENLTILEIEKFSRSHPGWHILYFHCKGAFHNPSTPDGKKVERWRNCMMRQCVMHWKRAVHHLDEGYEACGVHWRTGVGVDRSQHYFAGNFFWVTSKFFATIPSMTTRARIKMSGIASLESRYEAEVVLGNGPRLPRVKDLDTTHSFYRCP